MTAQAANKESDKSCFSAPLIYNLVISAFTNKNK